MNQSYTQILRTQSGQTVEFKTSVQITKERKYTPTYIEARTPHKNIEIITRCDVSHLIDIGVNPTPVEIIAYLQSRAKVIFDSNTVVDYDTLNYLTDMLDDHISHCSMAVAQYRELNV